MFSEDVLRAVCCCYKLSGGGGGEGWSHWRRASQALYVKDNFSRLLFSLKLFKCVTKGILQWVDYTCLLICQLAMHHQGCVVDIDERVMILGDMIVRWFKKIDTNLCFYLFFIEMAEHKNPVWQHFGEPSSGKARCAICKSLVSMGSEKGKGKNTSNMWSHM